MHDRCRVVRDIVDDLNKGEFRTETHVRRGIVDPLLQTLGWPVFKPHVVNREYAVEEGRVDYALCPRKKPLVFIEAKKFGGVTDAGRRQLFRYGAAHGVPLAVLTDGREWHFYLPLRQGTLAERRLPPINLSSDATEVCERLRRYLEYRAVTSGENIEAATRDLEQVQFERACESVWRRLVAGSEDTFLAMFLEAIADEAGIAPPRAKVAEWLRRRAATKPDPPTPPPTPNGNLPTPVPPPVGGLSVVFRGRTHECKNQKDGLVMAFRLISEENEHFLESYALRYGKARVSRDRDEIRRQPAELPRGWWIMTALGCEQKIEWIKDACRVAGVTYGEDLIANICPPGRRGR